MRAAVIRSALAVSSPPGVAPPDLNAQWLSARMPPFNWRSRPISSKSAKAHSAARAPATSSTHCGAKLDYPPSSLPRRKQRS
jgi:hypothetical protein